MFANRILSIILNVLSFVIIPVQLVTTLILGLGCTVTFGLLLLPLSLVWIACFWAPMLGISWVARKAPYMRSALGIVFMPLAVLADIYVALMPSMGEIESRALKLMFVEAWPFCWEFHEFSSCKFDAEYIDAMYAEGFKDIVERMAARDPIMHQVVSKIISCEILDPK